MSNQFASGLIGFDAASALAAPVLIAWRASLPRVGAPIDSVLVPAIAAGVSGVVLCLVWLDARRRGAPDRAKVAHYRLAEESWREDLDPQAEALAARSRQAALTAMLELDADPRTALLSDLTEAARVLLQREDIAHEVATILRTAPFVSARYDDRV